ncbi:MAG: CHAT domain-containing protein [Acidobacteriia bacterium]|nr:CHAT domain-containing protein [Terriglobia bacterium]
MRPADKHLTPQELDLLLLNPADSRDSNATGALPPEAQQHLNGCMYCQSVADKCRKAEEALRNLRTWSRTSGGGKALAPGSECPPEDTWSTLAAGLMEDEKAAPFITHAATCGWCGPRLKEAMHDLADDITAEEQEALEKLPSASPGWQRAMARELAAKQRKPKDPQPDTKPAFRWWPKLAWATALPAVAIIAVGMGWLVWLKTREPDVNALLAQAYTEQRTIELRMRGAAYAPMRVSRGKESSSLNRPSSLLHAEFIIGNSLSRHHDDPDWLDKKGRAELLDGHYDAAIGALSDAKKLNASSTILTDLATAYFGRWAAGNQPADYQAALDFLDQALQKDPNDPIALFNRAIVHERNYQYANAIQDWEKYLLLFGNDDWADEARHHLQALREKVQISQEYSKPLMGGSAFAQNISAESDASWQTVDARIEEYLDQAVRLWLPAAFSPQETEASRKNALQALRTLAQILAQRHGDHWLLGFLDSPHSLEYKKAVLLLGDAITENAAGNFERAEGHAKEADGLFRIAGNVPGSNRARLEMVYALHRSVQGGRCEIKAELLEKELNAKLNPWLAAQLLIEHSICTGMTGHLDKSETEIADAIAIAQKASYSQLYLRALGIAASMDTEMGRPNAAWGKDRAGLAIYWSGSYSPQRAYQFYSDMGFFSERSGKWSIALALAREGAAAAIRTHNPMTEALARFRLASAASTAGSRAEAIREFEAAGKLYEGLPQNQTTRTYLLNSQISLAELKTLNGESDVSLKSLEEAELPVSKISDYTIPLRLYVVLGEIYSRQGRWKEARAAYTQATLISEQALNRLHEGAERLRWERQTQRAYRGLLKCYLQQTGDPADALEFWEWYKAAAARPAALRELQVSKQNALLVNVKAAATPVRFLDRLRSTLRKEVVISYVQLPDEIISWTFDDRGVRLVRVPVSTAEFDLTATRFLDQCSDPNSSIDALRANGKKLYSWLIAPQIQNMRPDDQVTIEPDGEIAKVPFAALVDENGKYLGGRFAIAFSPGAYYQIGRTASHALMPEQRALVVAPPAFTSETGLKPLPDALQEADAVAGHFHHPLQLTGTAATLEAVERALSNTEIFHYVGHSYGNYGSIGLLLAGDSRQAAAAIQEPAVLTAERISRLKLSQLRLVVLSSCSTESNPDQVLTDPDELVRAFLQAGADQVIASRWSVDSAATLEVMEISYARFAIGTTVARVFQLDRLATLNARTTAHPYFWASMDVFSISYNDQR